MRTTTPAVPDKKVSELRVRKQLLGFGLVGSLLRDWVSYAVRNGACVVTNYLGVAGVVTHLCGGGGRHHLVVTLTWWMLLLGEEADIEVSVLIFFCNLCRKKTVVDL